MAEPIKLKVQVLKLVLPDPTVPTVVTQSLGVKEFTFVKELGEGGMRRAYIYKDADKEIIVKEFKDSKRNTYDQQLKESAGSMFADWYAREFNLRLEKTKYEKRKRVRFVKPMLGRILNGLVLACRQVDFLHAFALQAN
uniref:Alpha-type protein kinase domain-containing protein n=1 Tax=Chromera velia CCMP2878 TaxID=1169474 RepID=A0A0G4F1Q2_9ALVE|eukprot:Cvel_14607.t1-p1 / transcript=Cvel_14607.t1 / gene=Cvel_14607 / organism=Chromera_velia_CCMP2878 / gene_product=hypothetical protein / transcript_product=hypothetical protein / location=Cvel_scaffold1044:40164-40577(+) / protein_length=138 / sequence_SO=supercontig / SO=protein_coding / is_pseudo=false